jgi:hypothetical protein
MFLKSCARNELSLNLLLSLSLADVMIPFIYSKGISDTIISSLYIIRNAVMVDVKIV